MKKFLVKFLTCASYRLLINYKTGHYLHVKKFYKKNLFIRYLRFRQLRYSSCQLSYSATIGTGIKFPHPINIVIGDGVVIKDNVKIWRGVTIGSDGRNEIKKERRYPVVESNVKIYTGSTIIGNVNLGRNSIVGANSLVTENVPPYCVVAGMPARITKRL